MAEPASKNVTRTQDTLTISQPFDVIGGVIATALYALILYALFDDGFPLRQVRTGYVIAFAITTAIWVWYMAGRRIVTVFDATAGKMYRKNLLRTVKALNFADIDGIVEVFQRADCTGGRYYKIAPKANPYGKGYRLTKTYPGGNIKFPDIAELYDMRVAVIPAIEEMVGLKGRAEAAEVDLDSTAFYSRVGRQYIRRFWRRPLVFLCFGLALAAFGWGEANNWAVVTGLGIAAAMLLLPVSKLVLDTDEQVVLTYNLLGLREQRRIPFADYLAVESTRNSTNGIYTGTALEMCFDGDHKNVPLATVYFTSSLAGVAAETEAIIRSARPRDDS